VAARERKEHENRHFFLCILCVLSWPFTLAFPSQVRVRPRRRQRLWRGKKDFGYFEKTARFRKNFEFYFLWKKAAVKAGQAGQIDPVRATPSFYAGIFLCQARRDPVTVRHS
jgi:hypothetical protein